MNDDKIMNLWLAIALGGASGAMSRYWLMSYTISVLGKTFPYATLFVNVSGSFVLGFLSVVLWSKWSLPEELKLAIIVGFLGSFTTFSTFSLDVLNSFLAGHYVRLFIYIIASVSLSIVAVGLGYLAAKVVV
ncbi:MAG: fluoride efflux transporter CrcB [Gammaproteobacteria bacterium]|nr:fluoride efflux transporter CrcB [Gammaproteobacteria bacterium]